MRHIYLLFFTLAGALLLGSCRKEPHGTPSPQQGSTDFGGQSFYLLNQGVWGTNKASLDYYDATTGAYVRDIYTTRNPDQVKSLGDVGNDLQIYGGKMYAVLNGSNKVEVIDLATTRSLGKVDVNSPRNIRFADGKGYITSYLAVGGKTGEVVAIDTTSFAPVWRVPVGREPEELLIDRARLYVANSGGFKLPDYERTLSVIPLATQKVEETIDVGINLELIRRDALGQLWVTGRGNYANIPATLYCLSTNASTGKFDVEDLHLPCTRFDIRGDSLIYYHTTYDAQGKSTSRFGMVNIRTRKALASQFITDGSDREIVMPLNILFHPKGGNIYILDAKDSKSSGELFIYSYDGKLRQRFTTGDMPAQLAFCK